MAVSYHVCISKTFRNITLAAPEHVLNGPLMCIADDDLTVPSLPGTTILETCSEVCQVLYHCDTVVVTVAHEYINFQRRRK